MPPDPLVDEDSDYASAEDSDFAPDAAPLPTSDASSDSESDAESHESDTAKKPKSKSAKRKRDSGITTQEAEDVGFENSGDEQIVQKGLKRQKRKGKKENDDDDEGGEGGFVRTRRMAALAPEERKPLASTATATVDVDALWASMISVSTTQTAVSKAKDTATVGLDTTTKSPHTAEEGRQANNIDDPFDINGKSTNNEEDEGGMIKIQRTYNFAGKVHVEEKLVPRDSAEARLWTQLQSSGKTLSTPSDPNAAKPLKPPRKARRSIFEPITESLPKRTDLRFGVNSISRNNGVGVNGGPAKKLNTVEKSKMDWAGFVDKEGIKDELETAGKAKGAYLDQREFLARVEDKREEEARRARVKGLKK